MEFREKIAWALFRCGFHPDDPDAVLLAKWKEWPEEQARQFKRADAILNLPEILEALETAENLRANQERQRRMIG